MTVINEPLTLGINTQVILININGEPVVLMKPMTYRFRDIQDQCKKASNGLVKKYFLYIYHELTVKEKPKDEEQSIRAAVSRGKTFLMRLPLDSGIISESEILFSWKKDDGNPGYYLRVEGPFGKKVMDCSISEDTFYRYKPDTAQFTSGLYRWIIWNEKNVPSNALRYTFIIKDKGFIRQFETELGKYKTELTFGPEINSILLAEFYEDHLFYNDALKVLVTAGKEFPGNKDIQELFTQFKIRRGLML